MEGFYIAQTADYGSSKKSAVRREGHCLRRQPSLRHLSAAQYGTPAMMATARSKGDYQTGLVG